MGISEAEGVELAGFSRTQKTGGLAVDSQPAAQPVHSQLRGNLHQATKIALHLVDALLLRSHNAISSKAINIYQQYFVLLFVYYVTTISFQRNIQRPYPHFLFLCFLGSLISSL